MRIIDHIVYAVPDFDKAIEDLEEKLGVRPVTGGKHLLHGTKNALVNLGNTCYLEILAPDSENKEFKGERWMGVDLITESKFTRWAIKSIQIEKESEILRKYEQNRGQISGGERKTPEGESLSWKMTLPFSRPEVDIIPFITDWSSSAFHPTEKLNVCCQLYGLELFHPDSEHVQLVLNQLNVDIEVKYASTPIIKTQILGLNGLITL